MKNSFLEKLLTVPEIHEIQISRNSKFVAYTWENVHTNLDVFLIFIEKPGLPIALTKTPEASSLVNFSPDSRSVIIEEDKGGDERIRLFEVKIDKPKQMLPLTEENPPFFITGGSLCPNRQWLVYGANYDIKRKQEIEPTWVYKQNLKTGERQILAKPKKPATLYPELNSQGTYVLYNRKDLHPQGDQYWLVDIEGKEDKEILNFGPKAKVEAVWLPDGQRVAFITQTKNGKTQKYYSLGIYDLKKDRITWIIDDPNRNIEEIYNPSNGNYLVVLEYQRARVKPSIINLTNLEEKSLPKIKGSLLPIGPVKNKKWIGLYYSSTQPDEIVEFDMDNVQVSGFKSLTQVWSRTALKPEDFTPAEDFEWKGKDGLKIHGWLYRSKTISKKAIIYVHGGPTYHYEDAIYPQIQYLVSSGFNVLVPNYRGSTGYGVEFENLIRINGWGSDEQEDIWEGAKALIKQGIAEQGKIGITGISFGGYSSWYAITKAPELFSAAVPICGMTDLVTDYKTTRPDLRPYAEEMIGGSPDELPDRYYERSPINFVHQIKGKLLIVQGARDPNVTPQNVREIKKRLDKAGIKYNLLVFKDEGHGITKIKNKKILYKKIVDFFTKALK